MCPCCSHHGVLSLGSGSLTPLCGPSCWCSQPAKKGTEESTRKDPSCPISHAHLCTHIHTALAEQHRAHTQLLSAVPTLGQAHAQMGTQCPHIHSLQGPLLFPHKGLTALIPYHPAVLSFQPWGPGSLLLLSLGLGPRNRCTGGVCVCGGTWGVPKARKQREGVGKHGLW